MGAIVKSLRPLVWQLCARRPDGASDPRRTAPQIETLVEIIGRLWDWAPSNHRCLHKRLARSRLDPIDAGRFPWEDAGDQDAKIVTG
jgi:hypothetical protein